MRLWAIRAVLAVLLFGGVVGLLARDEHAESGAASAGVNAAYCDGRVVSFSMVAATRGGSNFTFGPWHYGERLTGAKPSDKHPNLYFVSPGRLMRSQQDDDFDHSLIIARVPAEAEKEWDVYWAIVLDPALHHDFRSERELLVAAQSGFDPGDLYELGDAPGHELLGPAGIHELTSLERFRRKDGTLPRLIILPAGFSLRATASDEAASAR